MNQALWWVVGSLFGFDFGLGYAWLMLRRERRGTWRPW